MQFWFNYESWWPCSTATYSDISSVVRVNSYLSKPFVVMRSLREGYHISFLHIRTLQPLWQKLECSRNIPQEKGCRRHVFAYVSNIIVITSDFKYIEMVGVVLRQYEAVIGVKINRKSWRARNSAYGEIHVVQHYHSALDGRTVLRISRLTRIVKRWRVKWLVSPKNEPHKTIRVWPNRDGECLTSYPSFNPIWLPCFASLPSDQNEALTLLFSVQRTRSIGQIVHLLWTSIAWRTGIAVANDVQISPAFS